MNIAQSQKIIADYQNQKDWGNNQEALPAIQQALKWVDEQVMSDVFNLAAIGSSNEVTYKEQDEARCVLFSFLDQAINFQKTPPVFLSNSAQIFKGQIFDGSNLYTGNVHIYQSAQNLGIQEKYIRGMLNKTHWLTDLDIQRSLKYYGLGTKVKISPFTEPSLRATIDLAVKDQANAAEPYTIPLILNRGSLGSSQGTHWLSAQITIDSVGHKISYRIEDSLKLSAQDKQSYQAIIEEALAAKADEFHNPFAAEDGWIIDKSASSITGDASQTDGYSCGYRALRQLLSDPAVRGNDLNAKQYSDLPLDSESLVSALFYHQLDDLSVSTEIFDGLGVKGQSVFSKSFGSDSNVRTVDLARLTSFLTDADKAQKKEARSTHQKVDKVVSGFNKTNSLLRFPDGAKDDKLLAAEYESFFTELHGIEQNNLKRIDLPYVTSDALDGVSSYFALNPVTAFKELGLFIDPEPFVNKEAFFRKLKLSMYTLSKAGLEKIELHDAHGKLSEANLDELKKFAIQVGLTCKIKLPAQYATSALQRELDRVIERNQQKKNSAVFAQDKRATSERTKDVKAIRKREKLDFGHSKQVDIELQDSVEAEVSIETGFENTQENTHFTIQKTFSLYDLKTAVNGDDFAAFAMLNVMMKKDDFVKAWHQLFGNIAQGQLKIGSNIYPKIGGQVVFEPFLISKISEDALRHLLKDGHLPAGGIDFQHLPQGFVFINDDKDRGRLILHYDANCKDQDLVAPIIADKSSDEPLIIDLAEEMMATLPPSHLLSVIWKNLNESEAYDSRKNEQFRELLLDMVGLTQADQTTLIGLCGGPEDLNFDRLKAFFKHRSELAGLYKEPFDVSSILNLAVVDKSLRLNDSEAATREGLIKLAFQAEAIPVKEHPLLKIMAVHPDLQSRLEAAIEKYHLSSAACNDLARIYSSHGVGGINKVLQTWQEISQLKHISPEIAAQIINNSDPYTKILTSKDLLAGCQRLNDFSQDKRAWFLQLYANHAPKTEKNFTSLLDSFAAFSQQVDNGYHLSFYSLAEVKEPFTTGIDMRTAMGRMLSLMKACPAKDLDAQWACISQIDLRSNTAVRAIQPDRYGRSCHFVVPEMRINPDATDLTREVYDTVMNVQAIAPYSNADDEASVKNRFFRYLSYQEHRMPLSFYIQAAEQIEAMGQLKTKIERTEINTLYRLLAEMTTGKNYTHFIHDEHAAIKQWESIIEHIKGAQLKGSLHGLVKKGAGPDINAEIYKGLISNLGALRTLPSIEVLDKLVILMSTSITQYTSFTDALKFKASMTRLENSNLALRELTSAYGDTIYMGMKFYNEDSYKKTYHVPDEIKKTHGDTINLFEHHTLLAKHISEKKQNGFDLFAMPLISTFSLDYENIEALYQLHQRANTPIKSALMEYMGTILLDINNKGELNAESLRLLMTELVEGEESLFSQIEKLITESFEEIPKLDQQFLEGTLTRDEEDRCRTLRLLKTYLLYKEPLEDTVKKLAKDRMVEFLETNPLLKAALPTDYVANLKSKKAAGSVSLLINQSFKSQELKDKIDKIREKISLKPEEAQLGLINDIAVIINRCQTESEKLEVAEALSQPQLFTQNLESYSKLLLAIKTSGSTPFVYYMQQAQLYAQRNNNTPVDELCEKAAYFISKALPNLANRFNNVNIVELVPLISSVISAGQQNELSTTVIVGDTHTTWKKIEKGLLAAKNDPAQLEVILNGLDVGQQKAIQNLGALQAHLNQLKNPTVTQVQISSKEEEVPELGGNKTDGLTQYTFETREVDAPQEASFFKKAIAFFTGASTKPVKKFYKRTTTFKEVKDPDRLNEGLVNQVIDDVRSQQAAAATYGHALMESMSIINQLVGKYPSAKSMLLPLIGTYLEYKGTTQTTEAHIQQAYGNLDRLSQEFTAFNDKDMVISLCEHFSKEGHYQFSDLITILNGGDLKAGDKTFDFSGYTTLANEARKQLFTVITALLNNKKTCDLSDVAELITHFKNEDTGKQYVAAITAIYKKAPYPELTQFNQWWEQSVKEADSLGSMMGQYSQWSKKPVAREDGSEEGEEAINGFNLEYAKGQYKKMSGITYTDKELEEIKSKTQAVKDWTTGEILEQIKKIRENPELAKEHKKDPTQLVALMAELLYRTKGMPQEGIGQDRKWGQSFEINTTQYLAVHSLLKSEKSTIAGIGTGEGKTRIMMISLAAQWALGQTVDFVTSDVSLATRDYLEFQAYFKSFGAQTNLITAQTPIEQYCMDGINFSDASNLSLFRNKARSQGLSDEVLNPTKEARCLLLDEADKTLFDTIDTRYNYSAQADQSIQDMPWIYEGLVEFFSIPANQDLFHGPASDADECNRQFKAFVHEKFSSENNIQKLEGISGTQLESWQASAITALNLEYGKDFTLEANVALLTKKGPSIVSQARLISDGMASKNAKFSFGVHQCLHARLNLEKAKVAKGAIKGDKLHQELSKAAFNDRRFPVDTENQIIYSSTSKSLISDYDIIRGVTGTPGSLTERAEKAQMAFIDIPRHRGLKRIDKPYRLAKTNAQQFEQVLSEIRAALRNNQPLLIFCKDDIDSKQLFDWLTIHLKPEEREGLERISADTSIAGAEKYIKDKAGKKGSITLSTARLGRGVDVPLRGEAASNGMHVIGTYLPKWRDYSQSIARAGRFGAKGSSRLILSEESIRANFGHVGQIPQEFYTATESYLSHLQTAMDGQIQKQRIIKDAVSDFRMHLTSSFFEKFFRPQHTLEGVNPDLMIARWGKFFDDSDKMWNETWPKISEALAMGKMEQVECLLQNYQAEVQGYWKGMLETLKLDFVDSKEVNVAVLPEGVGSIKLSQRDIELLQYEAGSHGVLKTSIVEQYDEAYKGRAVIYKGFWKNLWNNVLPSIFSWNDTPYTQARKNGNMSWSQFLLGGKLGTPPRGDTSTFRSSLSEQQAIEQVNIGSKDSSTAKIFGLGVAGGPTSQGEGVVPTKQPPPKDIPKAKADGNQEDKGDDLSSDPQL